MGGLRVGARIGVVVAALALLVPAGASASSVSIDNRVHFGKSDPTLVFAASPGEANNVSVQRVLNESILLVKDAGQSLHAGNGCVALPPSQALCLTLAFYLGSDFPPRLKLGLAYADIDTSDGNDTVAMPTTAAFDGSLAIDAGPGDDLVGANANDAVIHGGDGKDTIRVGGGTVGVVAGDGNDIVEASGFTEGIDGGPGDDRLTGGPGNEWFTGGPGADDIRGGAHGFLPDDQIDYQSDGVSRPSLDVTLDDVANDGAPGEGDNIHSDIETVRGIDTGPNRLIGDDDQNILTAVSAFPAVIEGHGGRDLITGGGVADDLDGGAGPDVVSGLGGDDIFRVNDGEADSVSCGTGQDTVFSDALDGLTECELIQP